MSKVLTCILLMAAVFGADQPNHTFVNAQGVAIEGYDPVAYFTDNKPVKGNPAFSFDFDGGHWVFATAAHRDAFAAEPAKYAPQYGGFCAYGTSRGYKAIIDPTAFTIFDGKLYLNYNASVQDTWRKDIPGYIRKADTEWPRVKDTTKINR